MMDKDVLNPAGMKILLVDDIPENIDLLVTTLDSEGYTLEMATSGEKALQIAANSQPDLILLDVMMPGMDGFEACRQLKKNDATNDIPVIFVTASREAEDIDQGFRFGGVDYISKPFRPEEVCARVRTHLHLRALMKQQEKLIVELQEALAKVKTLRGLLPICASCNKIRDDKGYWNRIEAYVEKYSEAEFSHAICPVCAKELYPGYNLYEND